MLLSPLSNRVIRCSRLSTICSTGQTRYISRTVRRMATVDDSIPHVVRTAHEPRQAGMWQATLSKIDQINSTIRLLRLSLQQDSVGLLHSLGSQIKTVAVNGDAHSPGHIVQTHGCKLPKPPLRHLPGQYVDLQIPGVPTVGGFTITSAPQAALPSSSDPYIELAIQKCPGNPPAAYLWQPSATILNSPMSFRIGGNFAYPPLTLSRQECERINQAVFVAGGVGINPIMSMLSAMDAVGEGKLGGLPAKVRVLYTSRRSQDENETDEKILFEERLAELASKWRGQDRVDYRYTLFETAQGGQQPPKGETDEAVKVRRGRIQHADLLEALGSESERRDTVVYVCGVPQMTDEFVELLRKQTGMEEKRVLCEKWW